MNGWTFMSPLGEIVVTLAITFLFLVLVISSKIIYFFNTGKYTCLYISIFRSSCHCLINNLYNTFTIKIVAHPFPVDQMTYYELILWATNMELKSYVTQLWHNCRSTKAITWKVNQPRLMRGLMCVCMNNSVIQGSSYSVSISVD